MAWTWEEMIEAFRALGGAADNIAPGTGARGRGIFPIDRAEPVRLHVPENLLIAETDVEFVDGRLKIRDSARCGQPEREFFEEYQNVFSWGGEGRSDCAAFFEALDRLPPEILSRLKREPDSGRDRIEREFLKCRGILINSKLVLMPVIELVNHGVGAASYDISDGVSIEGIFPDEVLVRYDLKDAFGIFRSHNFASPESVAFSLPVRNPGSRKLFVGRNTALKSKRGQFEVPNFRMEGDTLVLSYLMIGNKNFPRLSKGIFCTIAREAGWTDPEEEFDAIVHNNRMSFLKLLELLEPLEGGLVPTVRRMACYQLEAISHCIGTREL